MGGVRTQPYASRLRIKPDPGEGGTSGEGAPSWCPQVISVRDALNTDGNDFCFLCPEPLLTMAFQEVPSTASSYVESALKPFYQLQHGHGHKVKAAMMKHWVQEALSESTHR